MMFISNIKLFQRSYFRTNCKYRTPDLILKKAIVNNNIFASKIVLKMLKA